MNERLRLAMEEAEQLSEKAQDEIALTVRKMAAIKRIEDHLAESEAEGGAIPNDEVFAEIKARHGF